MFKARPCYGFASHARTMTVNKVNLNMDGFSDILQQRQNGLGAPMECGGSVQYSSLVGPCPTVAAIGFVMNFDGIPDELEQPQISYAAPIQYAVTSSLTPSRLCRSILLTPPN